MNWKDSTCSVSVKSIGIVQLELGPVIGLHNNAGQSEETLEKIFSMLPIILCKQKSSEKVSSFEK